MVGGLAILVLRSPDPLLSSIFRIMISCDIILKIEAKGVWATRD